jgi:hypothetical protein
VVIGDYELLELVEQTNMSEVWRAKDRRNGRAVAIKRRPETVRTGHTRRSGCAGAFAGSRSFGGDRRFTSVHTRTRASS